MGAVGERCLSAISPEHGLGGEYKGLFHRNLRRIGIRGARRPGGYGFVRTVGKEYSGGGRRV